MLGFGGLLENVGADLGMLPMLLALAAGTPSCSHNCVLLMCAVQATTLQQGVCVLVLKICTLSAHAQHTPHNGSVFDSWHTSKKWQMLRVGYWCAGVKGLVT